MNFPNIYNSYTMKIVWLGILIDTTLI